MSLSDLLENERRLRTRMGTSIPGERVVFRGKDLHTELSTRGAFELYLYGITGQFYTESELRILNFIWNSTSYPESRIWNNRIAALAGSTRSTAGLAIGAGVMATEATIYGCRPCKLCLDFFLRANQMLEQGVPVRQVVERELAEQGVIFGYGRPISSIDERIPPMMNMLRELGMEQGKFVKLALKIGSILREEKGLRMNIVSLYGAIAADVGFSPIEFHLFTVLASVAGMPPCYLAELERAEGCFFPVRCNHIQYEGPVRRTWD